MSDEKIAEIRARHERDNYYGDGLYPGAHKDRAWLLAEVKRQNRHIDLLQEKVNAEKSCACSYDNPDDVCVSHSPQLVATRAEIERLTRERDEARAVISTLEIVGKADDDERAQLRAEVERLIEWQSINHSEQHKLGWSMTEFCEGKRDHLHEMWERPPSLDYGIAHIEAEIKRLRAHNARLRAQIAEYFAEPTTHLVEDAE